MKTAVYSGTFDPITIGHLDIIKKGLTIFDKLIIAVAKSTSKSPMFSLEDRIKFVELSTKGLNVEVVAFESLMVEFCQKYGIKHIIRGVRTNIDFEYELNMSYANRSLDANIETIFLTSNIELSYISSSLVREILRFGGDVSHLVSKNLQLINL
jgi:pantetheine-phosphate adenylyltransferase